MQAFVLDALRDVLQGKNVLLAKKADAGASDCVTPQDGGQLITRDEDLGMSNGITHQKNGYKVEVGWELLTISTGFTKSITQAIDWQIALLRARGMAQAKMRRNRNLDPLVEEELLDMLHAEPSIELTFTVTVKAPGLKGKKISTPGVQDLRLAMEFRRSLLAIVNARKPESAFLQARKRTVVEATRARQKRRACEKQLLSAVNRELKRRSTAAKGQPSKKRKHDADDFAIVPCNRSPRKSASPRSKCDSRTKSGKQDKHGKDAGKRKIATPQSRQVTQKRGQTAGKKQRVR